RSRSASSVIVTTVCRRNGVVVLPVPRAALAVRIWPGLDLVIDMLSFRDVDRISQTSTTPQANGPTTQRHCLTCPHRYYPEVYAISRLSWITYSMDGWRCGHCNDSNRGGAGAP